MLRDGNLNRDRWEFKQRQILINDIFYDMIMADFEMDSKSAIIILDERSKYGLYCKGIGKTALQI